MIEWDWGLYPVLKDAYTEQFPLEIRELLTSFFDKNIGFLSWNAEKPSLLEQQLINRFIESMKTMLSQIFENLSSKGAANYCYKEVLLRPQYERVQQNQDSLQLFQVIWNSFKKEQTIISQNRSSQPIACSSSSVARGTTPTKKAFHEIKRDLDTAFLEAKDQCNNINTRLQELKTFRATLSSQSISAEDDIHWRNQLQQEIQEIAKIDIQINNCFQKLTGAHKVVLEELEEFKDKQRLVPAAIRKETDKKSAIKQKLEKSDPEYFETWFKSLSDCLSLLGTRLPDFNYLCRQLCFQPVHSSEWSKQIKGLRGDMLKVCCVIEKQPWQIIRTDKNMGEVILRVLPCSKDPMQIISVEPLLINKETAIKVKTNSIKESGELPKSSGDLTYDIGEAIRTPKSRKLHANNVKKFFKMSASNVIRSAKKDGQETVMEEKFWIYFRVRVKFTWPGCTNTVNNLHVMTLPLAVTTYPSQEAKAWPHIVWFNACPAKLRTCHGLEGLDKIDWKWLIEIIDLEFGKVGRKLTDEQKNHLKDKLFRGRFRPDEAVRFEEFCSNNFATMSGDPEDSSPVAGSSTSVSECQTQTISFGEWLYYTLSFLKPSNKSGNNSLAQFWADGKILGFLSNRQVENKLKTCSPGTFVIRFPEKWAHHIGLYFYNEEATEEEKLLKFAYKPRDLTRMSLEERILESSVATNLYSNYMLAERGHVVEKDKVFKRTAVTALEANPVDNYGYIRDIKMKIKEVLPTNFFRKLFKHTAER